MFDQRGPAQRRNDRSGVLQRSEVTPVWVDLPEVYGRSLAAGPRGRPDPNGVDLSARVPGELLSWHRTTTGEWVGWVCAQIVERGQVRFVYTYVLAPALSPREL